jgi:hypothetical protein
MEYLNQYQTWTLTGISRCLVVSDCASHKGSQLTEMDTKHSIGGFCEDASTSFLPELGYNHMPIFRQNTVKCRYKFFKWIRAFINDRRKTPHYR